MRYSLFKLALTVVLFFGVNAYAEDIPAAATKLNSAVTAEGAYVNIPLPGKTTTAAFFTLRNSATRDIALVSVHTDIAERAELHSHSHKDGVMRMRREEQVIVPANSSIAFESGSWHVMLFNVTRTLQTGEQLHLTLLFNDGTSLPIVAQVRSLFDKPHH